ncbi:MAG TPA: glycosyltransferase family 2 protein [Candidatus Saccharimonadales bacterium]|nr:glycosyltransferase family 2 protein [Candidatus Saccharimonadales bacterium]
MSVKKRVAIVIPAYNESKAIGGVIEGVDKLLAKQPFSYEIVVVDDGSADTTADVAAKKGATVIRHILNSGSGGATATGLSYADRHNFDAAATIDADGQHSPKDLLNGVQIMLNGNVDLLIGSRLINSEGMSKVKILGNRGLSFITYVLFGVSSTDSQSGLRVFSSKALRDLKWKTNGYEFCSEMLWRAKQQGLRIDEYPIEAIYTDYSKSKGQNNWNAFNIIKSLLRRRIMEIIGE